jgi:hypothetical protein
MAGIQGVSFTSPYAAEEMAIERRKKLAEQLAKNAGAPLPTEMVGGWAVKRSPLEGLARVAQAGTSAYLGNQAEQKQRELSRQLQGDAGKWVGSQPQGTPAQIQDTTQEGTGSFDMSGSQGPANVPAQPPSQQAVMGHLMKGLQNPMTAPIAQARLAQVMKQDEPYTLPDGGIRMGPNGPIYENKKDVRPVQQAPSDLDRLLREKAALPPGDPRHETYANAIRKASETPRQISPTVVNNHPQPVTSIVVQDKASPTGWSYKDARTGKVTSTGAPAPSGSTERENIKGAGAQQRATAEDQRAVTNALKAAGYDPATGTDKIEELIGKSTSGGLEKAGAAAAGFFGVSTSGRVAANTLEAAANRITLELMNRKLGAGISNADRDFIVGQLGDVQNTNKPSEERAAAWRFARSRMIDVGLLPTPGIPTTPPAPIPDEPPPGAVKRR